MFQIFSENCFVKTSEEYLSSRHKQRLSAQHTLSEKMCFFLLSISGNYVARSITRVVENGYNWFSWLFPRPCAAVSLAYEKIQRKFSVGVLFKLLICHRNQSANILHFFSDDKSWL